ncbi:MAG: anaerobic ribonucleoside-triphosphate reductase activating protein [Rhodoferax sp.]|nr:anaerobic ribonucleoside-triphosphate reductase activating protein [Rhodoferax sp.]MDP3651864.1 anaerobic ribonucleoside-triphosphate reductase activating protein [Rhodoferax sp.]
MPLKVGGITPFTATDYPGKLAAVVFVQGCPWACAYCHNPHLQPRTEDSPVAWAQVLALFQRRVGLIDAVVFSGGEPTMDPALAEAMRQVRTLGFCVGLHTAGMYPRRLQEVLPLVDWVGMDIKATPQGYDAITRVRDSARGVWDSAAQVLASGVAHEFRTTVHPALQSEPDLLALAQTLSALGVRHYALQVFRGTGCVDPALGAASTAGYPSAELVERVAALFETFTLRRD